MNKYSGSDKRTKTLYGAGRDNSWGFALEEMIRKVFLEKVTFEPLGFIGASYCQRN